MRIIVKQLSITALALGLSLVAVGQTTQPLSELMSEQEIEAMGLDKLSPAQQADLVQWIQQRREAPIAAESGEAAATAATAANSIPDQTIAYAAPKVAPAATTVDASSDENFGKPAPQADQMRSRIPGTFTGWTGGSQFVLENGQVWQQRYDTRWKTELDNPEVIITRHMLGLHRMEVVGTGKSVPVKRIK